MKHALVVGLLWGCAASDAFAQITEIHGRYGPSGSHVQLASENPLFHYEATIAGQTSAYRVDFEVYHNGVQKVTDSTLVASGGFFLYSSPVDMVQWGLRAGDTVTFVCKVIDVATGATLATHFLFGDVCGP